ncbi:MAG: CRISPR-associated helicase Cas3' [Candidatus Lambdaproteobacteria bacterium RIFOXYD1_FULL_56_27]|uniref:CRISPR-associated helicase Cas3 n=1 Tax=Candidatus Lambdaproteobacteria bacterium RIFOXYD2_FULL_56_26 TaxID=1817773 RepID=A0A1F6GL10_9PROT|nr:MAG: CRISPR-associated helicase Cas3' [Candidatus Lambdaproteobacteria bacterium RIFOXYD2_FULL_56_26]OGH04200.1 MAG: CRISPR-associated helicase Cas3' [Candidatus Lambdaproteobacteria bacterium RIFOXYC1_FULL_56_13]OGH08842.1 MAG: CRISPR-associated helicase Cas3' [Candidatus Lambdaproteobacteria bacterium RIFOXYD1_FULL_56_27]
MQGKYLKGLDYDLGLVLKAWATTGFSHHGKPVATGQEGLSRFFSVEDETAALEFVGWAQSAYLGDGPLIPPSDLPPETFASVFQKLSWWWAGFTQLADWLGSSIDFFPFESGWVDLEDYRQRARLLARRAVEQAGLTDSAKTKGQGTQGLFGFAPNPMQAWAERVSLSPGANLLILENLTGSGKTEAALVLCHRLMGEQGADGFFFGLPTLATANGMYPRLNRVFHRLFGPDASPSCVLAHSQKHLNPEFAQALLHWSPQGHRRDEAGGGETSGQACASWLADSNKTALLAEVGVGTLDQALLAVLLAKHQSLRLFGLWGKVLVVDEVHAYDDYMQACLKQLLEMHAYLGGSAILLSATLPQGMRAGLVAAFAQGAGGPAPALGALEFPLATKWNPGGLEEVPLPTSEARRREVILVSELDQVVELVLGARSEGACVCWIRNLVEDAQEAYRQLLPQVGEDDLLLFHARFAQVDRQRIETQVLESFGKTGTAEQRRGKVLIATQVVEQSLDLDFDLMISDLAPIDLILQRAGRQGRHVRDRWGNPQAGSDQRPARPFCLHAPDPRGEIGSDWLEGQGAAFLYHPGQLWLTAELLAQKGEMVLPEQARELIEGVYSDPAQALIPEPLLRASLKREGQDQAKRAVARLNLIDFAQGYEATNNQWNAEEQAPTRLGQDSATLFLARREGDRWVPYGGPDTPWELSRLSAPKTWVREFRPPQPSGPDRALADLGSDPALRYGTLLPLDPQTTQSPWPVLGAPLAYDSKLGLQRLKTSPLEET